MAESLPLAEPSPMAELSPLLIKMNHTIATMNRIYPAPLDKFTPSILSRRPFSADSLPMTRVNYWEGLFSF